MCIRDRCHTFCEQVQAKSHSCGNTGPGNACDYFLLAKIKGKTHGCNFRTMGNIQKTDKPAKGADR